MTFDEDIKDFLIESNENLETLDRHILDLERNPQDPKLIASIFRTIHTIKGTCGFFDFSILGSITHIAENLLSQAREKQREVTPDLISLVLETVDAVKKILRAIEETGKEGEDVYQELRRKLGDAYKSVAPESAGACEVGATNEDVEPVAGAGSADITVATEQAPSASVLPVEGEGKAGLAAESTIRVDVRLLDQLMDLVGELVLARNQLLQNAAILDSSVSGTTQRLNLITSELQESVTKTRMQPIGVVWNKLPRVVRDIASDCGKKIQVEMVGAGTELDKTIIEAIKDPLTHIVRNSCDHGIELPEVRVQKGKNPQGKITLRAYHEGGHVNIEMSDDGAGINADKVRKKAVEKRLIGPEDAAHMSDAEAVQLTFQPGFSTADQITSISGRGVGMDVVRTNIERIGGTVDVFNQPVHGITVRIKIPLTLAIVPGLVVTLRGRDNKKKQRFVISQTNLLELVRLEGADQIKRIESVHGTPVYHHRGRLVPLVYLNRVFGRNESNTSGIVNIVLLQAEDTQLGLVVDDICDTQEIVVKPLGKQLCGLTCYMGATIMGDGKIALILDVSGLARLAGLVPQSRQLTGVKEKTKGEASRAGAKQRLLLFRAGRFERVAVPLATVGRLEKFNKNKVEYASGNPVIHYHSQILPLVSLAGMFDRGAEAASYAAAELHVIVFAHGRRSIGLVVDRIEDIVEETVTVKRASAVKGLLGSAVVGGKVTDFIDLRTIVRMCGDDWLSDAEVRERDPARVLLVDYSSTIRELLRGYLEMAGYEVHEAAGAAQALAVIGKQPVNAIASGLDPYADESQSLIEGVCGEDGMSTTPVVALLDKTLMSVVGSDGLRPQGFAAWVSRDDRDALLEALDAAVGASTDTVTGFVRGAGGGVR